MTQTTETDQEFFSMGRAACQLQKAPHLVRAAMGELGIVPAFRLNGLVHINGRDLQRLIDHFARGRAGAVSAAHLPGRSGVPQVF